MTSLQITLFNGIHVSQNGKTLTLAYDKVRALLAYLLLESNKPQRRETLTGLLWPEQTEKEARHSLSQALLKLRQAINSEYSVVLANRHTVQLNPEAHIELDTAVFSTTLHQCQTHQHVQPELCEACMARRETVVSLYKGPFLAGLSVSDAPEFEQWQTQQRAQFQRQALNVLAKLTTYHEKRGELQQAIAYAQQQLILEPWQEETHRQLMRLMLYNGQRSRAIAQYLTCVQMLDDELGVPPSAETAALFKLIETAAPTPPHNLPIEPTPFVGRQAEIAQITSWLAGENGRLVTIIGPGGMGKTRLARSIAQKQLGRPVEEANEVNTYAFFTDGVFWVPLARVTTATALVPAIAEAIGLQLQSGESGTPRTAQQQLVSYLQGKRLLLLLDNFEQLLEENEAMAATQTVQHILQRAPHVQLLVTTRERLQLQEEQLFLLDGLSYPEANEDGVDTFTAVHLFKQTAQRVQPSIVDTATDWTSAADICRLLEGSPLAIELAASTMNMLAPSDILDGLQESLALLSTSNRHVPERHRSMQAAFSTSWKRLTPDLQHLLAQLSLFQNGFTLAAARAVAQAQPHQLSSLINQSLLRFDPAVKRYDFHELVRQFAAAELSHFPSEMETAVSANHATYYLSLFTNQEDALKGAKQFEALNLLEREVENGRLAWRWACQHQPNALLPAITPTLLFYDLRGRYQEGAALCQEANALLADSDSQLSRLSLIRGRLLAWNGRFLATLRQWQASQTALTASLRYSESSGSKSDIAFLNIQQSRLYWRDDKERATTLVENARSLATESNDQWLLAECYNLLGRMARATAQFQRAERHLSQSLAIRRTIQDQSGLAHTLSHLSLLQMDLGQFEQAVQNAHESLALYEQTNDLPNIANIYNSLGFICMFDGKMDASRTWFGKSLRIFKSINLVYAAEMTQSWLGGIEMMLTGDFDAFFLRQLARFNELQAAKSTRGMAYRRLQLASSGIGAKRWREAFDHAANGVVLFKQLGQTKEAAECSAYRSIAAQGEGRLIEAKRHVREYGRFLIASKTFFPTSLTLSLFILVALERNDYAEAIELHEVASSVPFLANSRWFIDVFSQPVQEVAQKLDPKLVKTAQARGQALGFWKTVAAQIQQFDS